MDILTILILPICEYGIYFHLFLSFSISFINVLQHSVCRSFISLVKFIPKYFILLDPIVNGTVFLIPSTVFLIYSGVNMVGFTWYTTTISLISLWPCLLTSSLNFQIKIITCLKLAYQDASWSSGRVPKSPQCILAVSTGRYH